MDAGGNEGSVSEPISSDNVGLAVRVGPQGGILEPTTGTVRLQIPAGALDRATTFTIRQLPSPPKPDPGRILVTRVFDIGPSGTRFDPPATLTLRYDVPAAVADTGRVPVETLAAQSWDPSSLRWVGLRGGTVDAASSTVTARIPHLPLRAAASLTVPHGGYSSDTDLCKACHQSHQAPGNRLLVNTTERAICYGCHDGTGASSDLRAEFGEQTIGSSTRVSSHPVPVPRDQVQLTCSDCHTPHRSAAEDTVLLRVQDGNKLLYSPPTAPIGNALCYGCHGTGSSLPVPFGDHSGYETSVHNTNGKVPFPPSGSRIKCLACHEPHGSDYPRLTRAYQEDLCFTCHTQADPNTSGGTNPHRAFHVEANDYVTSDGTPVRIYHHPIVTTEQDGGNRVVECASCHDPHLANRTDAPPDTKLVDPADTTSKWPVVWDPDSADMTRGNISDWCMRAT